MIIGRYKGVIKDRNEGRTYILVSGVSRDEAKTEANRILRVRKDRLHADPVFMDRDNEESFSFEPYDDCVSDRFAVWYSA